MILVVARFGNGEQRGDRSALDDVESVIGQAPFDVLRAAKVRLNTATEFRETYGLCLCQGGLCLPLRLGRQIMLPPA